MNFSFAQTKEQRLKITKSYDKSEAKRITEHIDSFSKEQKLEIERLVSEGFPRKKHKTNGTFEQLIGSFSDGTPIYYSIENQDSGVATGNWRKHWP